MESNVDFRLGAWVSLFITIRRKNILSREVFSITFFETLTSEGIKNASHEIWGHTYCRQLLGKVKTHLKKQKG